MATTVTTSTTIAAPPDVVLGLVEDVAQWPQWHRPAIHAERLVQGEGEDLVQHWSLRGDNAVRTWQARRELDRAAGRIAFQRQDADPVSGEWRIGSAHGRTAVELVHEVPDEFAPAVEHNSTEALNSLRAAAERRDELAQLVISFEDPLFIAGDIIDAYQVLYEAHRWPERMAHVQRLDMTEDEPGIQFFDMETKTPDGSTHTTRSVRICLPYHKIVYKQIKLPALLDAHTGHWKFEQTPEGVVASARHTATIKPSALHLLGQGTTVRDARRYLRMVLSTNSLSNLHVARDYAQGRRHA